MYNVIGDFTVYRLVSYHFFVFLLGFLIYFGYGVRNSSEAMQNSEAVLEGKREIYSCKNISEVEGSAA